MPEAGQIPPGPRSRVAGDPDNASSHNLQAALRIAAAMERISEIVFSVAPDDDLADWTEKVVKILEDSDLLKPEPGDDA